MILPDLSLEQNLWDGGFDSVAGLDEAGRGALAGPVAVAAVILPREPSLHPSTLSGVRDSKLMTAGQRARWADVIKASARAWSLGWAIPEEIDALGIAPSTRLAAERAIEGLSLFPDFLLTDFHLKPDTEIPFASLVKGDQKSLSIACASVLAKTARDKLMIEMQARYAGYDFSKHKGYGTAGHRRAIERLGHSAVHRRTFHFHKK
ncbi:MAG: Ribonuclease HII [Anaerolineales bacterium]|nr:Ribonuclease HII [Anaerolineales bacterium]